MKMETINFPPRYKKCSQEDCSKVFDANYVGLFCGRCDKWFCEECVWITSENGDECPGCGYDSLEEA